MPWRQSIAAEATPTVTVNGIEMTGRSLGARFRLSDEHSCYELGFAGGGVISNPGPG